MKRVLCAIGILGLIVLIVMALVSSQRRDNAEQAVRHYGNFTIRTPSGEIHAILLPFRSSDYVEYITADGRTGSVSGSFTIERAP